MCFWACSTINGLNWLGFTNGTSAKIAATTINTGTAMKMMICFIRMTSLLGDSKRKWHYKSATDSVKNKAKIESLRQNFLFD
ncbi:hypothetical protein OH492_07160 [Vibrio chagasii]|nr:hypothetical protein [Vibrio chagasii]